MLKRVAHLRGSHAILGAERVVLELAKRTPEFGYESIIVAVQGPDEPVPEFIEAARHAGIRAEVLPCRGRFDPTLFARLRRFVRRENIDLLHSHGYKENFYALLACRGVTTVASNHLWKRTSRALRLYCWLDSKLIRYFDHIVAVSEPIRQELAAAGVSGRKLSKISNGIDPEPFRHAAASPKRDAVRDSLGIAPGQLVIGMLSGLSIEKGHVYALGAIARLREQFPQLVLTVVGDGPRLGQLQATARHLGLEEHVRFCGRRSDVADVLAAFDIFLLPSLIEGLPMALLEAMAAGKAVVASRVGDIPTAVKDGETGLLVPPQDVAALTGALARLCAAADRRRQFGKAAADMIERHFSARRMAQEYCVLYDRIQQEPLQMAAMSQED